MQNWRDLKQYINVLDKIIVDGRERIDQARLLNDTFFTYSGTTCTVMRI